MHTANQQAYTTRSAVLFIIFNRPDVTVRVFEQIRQARPTRLYIAADGPRNSKSGEDVQCAEARKVATMIDWDCEVKTLFRDANLGCKDAVSSAVTWFFENEEEGIILEDDCLPDNSFFWYCDEMLARYRHDSRIRHIGGCNLQHGKKWGAGSYYYSNMTHVWGWAGWRRVWQAYDKNLTQYPDDEIRLQIGKIFTHPMVADDWAAIFRKVKAGQIDTWDYQLAFLNFFNNGLSIMPNCNLISNIGFGANSTHTADANNRNSAIPLKAITELTPPVFMLPEKAADFNTNNYDFNIEARYIKYNKPRYKLKRLAQKLFGIKKGYPN